MAAERASHWLLLVTAVIAVDAFAQVTVTRGTNFAVDAAADGRMVFDLLGDLWVVGPDGGEAFPVADQIPPARRPRWSPDGTSIVFEATTTRGPAAWLYDTTTKAARALETTDYSSQQPAWHPGGERITFVSARKDTGLDLYELDLPTGLTWRLSSLPGDELEPAWSENGRDLVFVHRDADEWRLVLRRRGAADETLVTSNTRLSSPSWRPDGSLITFVRHGDTGLSIDMIILSEPRLVRTLVEDDDLFDTPVAWPERGRLVYAANGNIRTRDFNSWTSRTIAFRAMLGTPGAKAGELKPQRRLPRLEEPGGRRVIRAARLFDGLGNDYRDKVDIVIEGGVIAAIEDQQERGAEIVIDLGDVTVMPGLIDAYGQLGATVGEIAGPRILSFGVTTLVASHPEAAALNERWSGQAMPGPRLLSAAPLDDADDPEQHWLLTVSGDMASGSKQRKSVTGLQERGIPVLAENWQAGAGSGATLALGRGALPAASPGGIRYEDLRLAAVGNSVMLVSGMADAATPGLDDLLESRQAGLIGSVSRPTHRSPEQAGELSGGNIVAGSRPNGLPAGLGLHAELRALVAAGLEPAEALKTAGVDAATGLGLGLQIGRIAVGSAADLVLVDGDPLNNIEDTLNVVALVRNGRFFSVIGLIERLEPEENVE